MMKRDLKADLELCNKATPDYDMRERAEKAEALLLMDNSLWQFAPGLSSITQIAWYELVAIHTELNKVLHKAKEVLGDE